MSVPVICYLIDNKIALYYVILYTIIIAQYYIIIYFIFDVHT